MRCAIVSDIHGNLTALQAVFGYLEGSGPIDQVWCMGDVVGYGPDPNECIAFLRQFDLRCVVGNHDLASVEMLNLDEFNRAAKIACQWTMSQLTTENREFLSSLPQIVVEGNYTLVHGSPRDPIWEYILSPSQAKASFHLLETGNCFVGHSHIPALYLYFPDADTCTASALHENQGFDSRHLAGRFMINPGSVGQPRDGDPRASCAVLDEETGILQQIRVPYDVGPVQRRMRKHGLPRPLAERLSLGW